MVEEKRLTVNMGPHHSAAIGPLRMKLKIDGEVVISGVPEVGFLHRGVEKIAEKMTWTGFLPFTDRIDYLAAIHCNHAYALAVESLASIEVPERANYIRIVVGELNRIASHLLTIGYSTHHLGLATGLAYALRDREKINNLFEMLSGSRLTYNYVRVGGVAADVTEGFIEKTYEFVDYIVPKLKEYNDLITNNRIFRGRLSNVGIVSSAQAIAAGVSGPILRASGIRYDTRKNHPYSGYHKFDFNIPTGKGEFGSQGDAFDRFMVRLSEIEQSCFLIKQAMDSLPEGAFLASLPRIFKAPAGESYAAVESPRGSFGVYVMSTGEKYPYRVRFRTPSFPVLNLFPDLLHHTLISDVSTIVNSLDIMVSEVDR